MGNVILFTAKQEVADIFTSMVPQGFKVTWHSNRVSDEEKIIIVQEADFVVLYPAEISSGVLQSS